MSGRKALGRGLDALIPGGARKEKSGEGELVHIEVGRIKASPTQPRKKFDEQALQELAGSIKSEGVLQPLLLKQDESDPDKYLLIAGERRFRAAKLAGLAKVPALIKKVDDSESLVMSLIENILREDLNPIEEARAFQNTIHKFKLSQEELAAKMGKDRSTVANALRLLKLPEEIQSEIEKGNLSAGHARAILALDSQAKMKILFRRILGQGLSVRQAEAWAKKLSEQEEKTHPKSKASGENRIYLEELERKLSRTFSARVKFVETAKNKGKMEIYYSNLEELERIIGLVGKK
jgi:ParB family transcriptional regulator, chromosome partitioning protein